MMKSASKVVAVIGNPNSGKSTLFNALTGMRQKVGNYPGVTVEKKEGSILYDDGTEILIIDLPGTYSLTANSPDERIATDVLLGRRNDTPKPSLVICVVDASNLERNLYLVSQLIDRQIPVLIALNMVDVASQEGMKVDAAKLSALLDVPVVPTVATHSTGIAELKFRLLGSVRPSQQTRKWKLPVTVAEQVSELQEILRRTEKTDENESYQNALQLLTSPAVGTNSHAPELQAEIEKAIKKFESEGIDRFSVVVEARYDWIKSLAGQVVEYRVQSEERLSDKLDAVLTHKVWGFVIFFGLMTLMFQTIFTWANVPMQWIGSAFSWLGGQVAAVLPPSSARDLIVNGAIAGVGAVVTFLPQIVFLFLFLGLLEDTGYMARAAFIMDRTMSKVGLHGKAFIPMLSSFACAIPGIMATRTIESPKDRLVTILVSPLMSCSARLPVYTLMIAAFIPQETVWGFLSLSGLVLVSMYMLGLFAALGSAWLFKKTLLKSAPPIFIMELPPYRIPSARSVLMHMWNRALQFLKRAGTIILAVSIALWFLASYPKKEHATPSEQLEYSFAGQAGKLLEPIIKPLGFDWKIGIGLIGSLLQREVFVSTMGTIYNIRDANNDSGNHTLREQMRNEVDPITGKPTFTALTAICLMVYYVLAMQCMSTVAVVRRETNSWRWPIFQIAYMTALAWVGTFAVYRIGLFF
jgi:ferrous iron transport protein B